MNCKRCGSEDVIRSRRRGIWDRIQSTIGNWPYRCEDCSYRFVAPQRQPLKTQKSQPRPFHHAPGEEFRAYAGSAQQAGPDMLFQTHVEKPHAKIVLQADTHEQLNHILIALNRAVNSYQGTANDRSYADSKAETAGFPR